MLWRREALSAALISRPGKSKSTGHGWSPSFLLELISSPTLWGSVSGGSLISGHWVLLIYKRSKRVNANKNPNTRHSERWNNVCYQDEDQDKEVFTVAFLCSSEAADSTVHRFWSCDKKEISLKNIYIYICITDPWTMWGVGALNSHAVKNPWITFDSPKI